MTACHGRRSSCSRCSRPARSSRAPTTPVPHAPSGSCRSASRPSSGRSPSLPTPCRRPARRAGLGALQRQAVVGERPGVRALQRDVVRAAKATSRPIRRSRTPPASADRRDDSRHRARRGDRRGPAGSTPCSCRGRARRHPRSVGRCWRRHPRRPAETDVELCPHLLRRLPLLSPASLQAVPQRRPRTRRGDRHRLPNAAIAAAYRYACSHTCGTSFSDR